MGKKTEQQAPEEEVVDVETEAETRAYLRGILEAILFVADRPLTVKEIARAAKIDKKRAAELIDELCAEHESRGVQIHEVSGGYCFRSNPEYSGYVRNFVSQRPVRLSRAQLETLAIVAYRQPITRPEVDDIRGVDSGPVLKGLLERDLIKILGKKDEPGRPMLYGSTSQFLDLFNMESLKDLPTLREFTELSDESRQKFESTIGEAAPEGEIDESAYAASSDADESVEPAPEEPDDADDDDADDDDADDDDADDDDADDDDAETEFDDSDVEESDDPPGEDGDDADLEDEGEDD